VENFSRKRSYGRSYKEIDHSLETPGRGQARPVSEAISLVELLNQVSGAQLEFRREDDLLV
jgi:hypothetical protein